MFVVVAVVSEMELVLVVLVVAVVVRALVWAGAVIDTLVEVSTVDMCVGMRIVVSDVAVDLAIGIRTNTDVDVFADLAMPGPFEEFRC